MAPSATARRWAFTASMLSVLSVVGACGAPLPEINPVVTFPTSEDLGREIARGERDDGSADPLPETAEVEAYVLPVGAPEFGTGNVAADHGPVGRAITEGGAARVVSTAGMACAAERLAAFVAEHGGEPTRDLLDFILGRCGVTSVGAEVLLRTDEVPGTADRSASSSAIAEGHRELADRLRRRLEGRPVPFEVEIGEAHLAAAGRRIYAVVFAPRRAALSASVLPDGRFLIAGRVEAERVRAVGAWVNQGAYGVTPCEADPRADVPDVRFTCEMNRHDAAARVELVVVPRQRLLPHRVAAIMLHRDDEASLTWAPQPELPRSATDGTVAEQIASALAVAREDAGEDPIPFAGEESGRQGPLFEAWLTTHRDGDRESADRALLAMLAGWQVEGAVVRGRLLNGDAAATDARAFVRRTLAGPAARLLLLGDGFDTFAVAAAEGRAAITVFRTWHPEEAADYREAWAAQLDAERRRHGLGPVTVLDEVLDLQQEADRVTTGELHPREALDNAMARLRGRLGQTVRGWYVEAYDPHWVVLPDAFLDSGAAEVVVGVAYLRPEGAAWGQVAFFVCAILPE